MVNLMNEMIREASTNFGDKPYAFAHRDTDKGKVTLYMQKVNTNATRCVQKRWKMNGKTISAKNLAAL